MNSRTLLVLSAIIPLAGCISSRNEYTPPPSRTEAALSNILEVDRPKEEVWSQLVSGLSTQFFIINNMDKSSGFINVSYSGDPEKYVEGGEVVHKVSNLRGPREYRFPASRANVQYEQFENGVLSSVQRTLNLEGRMNIVVSEVSASRTKVTANTRYVLTLNFSGRTVMGDLLSGSTETISFNTGAEASTRRGTRFRSTGELEASVLALVKVKNP